MKKFNLHKMVVIICLALASLNAIAATLPNFSVTPADLTAGETTTYTVQFDAASAISTSSTNSLRFITGSGGANLDNAFVQSTSGNITLSCTNCSTTNAFMWITASSVGPGDTVTIVLANVVNPPNPGLGPNYTMNVEDSSYSTVDTATITGSVYTSNSSPVVENLIPNQSIEEQDGAVTVDLNPGAGVNTNLNYTFTDGDGDPMTFSIVPGHDTSVVTAQVVSEELVITGQGTGSTSVTVQAQSVDGTASDTFNVSVIGSLAPASVTPSSNTAGETTNYTIVFQPATVINSGDFIILNSQTNSQNHTNSTLVSLSGGLSGTRSAGSASHTVIWLNGGSAGPGDSVTVVLGNIVNPGASGQAPDYTLRTTDGGSTTGIITVPGTVYGSTSVPTVANLIPNQAIDEEDGATVVDLNSGAGVNTDLNYTFVDGDGHPLTFSIDPGHDTNVVTAAVVNDELVITGQGTGSTTVTVRASDGIDGSVTDSFDVSVVGDLTPVTVLPSSLFTGEQENYTIVFSPATDLDSGDFVIFSTAAGGPDQTNSTLQQLSGGTLTGSITAGGATSTVVMFNGGSASPSDTITVVLGNVVNPAAAGQGPDYLVTTTDGGSATGRSTVGGDTFIASDLIFEHGFEAMSLIASEAKMMIDELKKQAMGNEVMLPEFDISFNRVSYYGYNYSLSGLGSEKSMLDLISWLEAVLASENPYGDFDGDGIYNQIDEFPFNY